MAESSLLRLLSTSSRSTMQSTAIEEEPWTMALAATNHIINKKLQLGKSPAGSSMKDLASDVQSVATEALTTSTAETTGTTNYSALFIASPAVISAAACINVNELIKENVSQSHGGSDDRRSGSSANDAEKHAQQGDEYEDYVSPVEYDVNGNMTTTVIKAMSPQQASRVPLRTQSIDSLDFADLMDWTIDSNIDSLVDSLATFAHDSDEVFCFLSATASSKPKKAGLKGGATVPAITAARKGRKPSFSTAQHDASEAPSINMDNKAFNPTATEQRSVAPMNVPRRRQSLVSTLSSDVSSQKGPNQTISFRLHELGIAPMELLQYIPREALQQAMDRYRAEAKLKSMIVANGVCNGSAERQVDDRRSIVTAAPHVVDIETATEQTYADTSSTDDDSIKIFKNPNHSRWEPHTQDCQSVSMHSTQIDALSSSLSSTVFSGKRSDDASTDQSSRNNPTRPPERPCRRGSVVAAVGQTENDMASLPPIVLTVEPQHTQIDDTNPWCQDPPSAEVNNCPHSPSSKSGNPDLLPSRIKTQNSMLQRHLEEQAQIHTHQLSGGKSISSRRSKRNCGKSTSSETTSRVNNRNRVPLCRELVSDAISEKAPKKLSTLLDQRNASSSGRGGRSVKSSAEKSATSAVSRKSGGAKAGPVVKKVVRGAEATTLPSAAESSGSPTAETQLRAKGHSYGLNSLIETTDLQPKKKKKKEQCTQRRQSDGSPKNAAVTSNGPLRSATLCVGNSSAVHHCEAIPPPEILQKAKIAGRGRATASSATNGQLRSRSSPQKSTQNSNKRSKSLPRSPPQSQSAPINNVISNQSQIQVTDSPNAKSKAQNILKVVKEAFRKGSARDISSSDFGDKVKLPIALSKTSVPSTAQRIAVRIRRPLTLETEDSQLARRSLSRPRVKNGSQRSINSRSALPICTASEQFIGSPNTDQLSKATRIKVRVKVRAMTPEADNQE
ncbi:hypothetical protein MPSEU_001043800 [Mayamaea pseudoterrestris]|nr:hypothetical protein MPSEU_001043800 [Mayamaea pseudoterrestris]